MIHLFSAFSLFLAWLLYAISARFLFKHTARQRAALVLGILGCIVLLSIVLRYGAAFLGGYLYEQVVFSNGGNGLAPAFMALEVLVAGVAALNVSKRFSSQSSLYALQVGLVSVYVLSALVVYGYTPFGDAISITPGWHTTVTAGTYMYSVLIGLALIWILNKLVSLQFPNTEGA